MSRRVVFDAENDDKSRWSSNLTVEVDEQHGKMSFQSLKREGLRKKSSIEAVEIVDDLVPRTHYTIAVVTPTE
jgi:hypothetical protein